MADLGKQFLDTDGLNALWTKHKKVQPFYYELGTSGTMGWVNFLSVTCSQYMNHPLVVRLLCRGYSDCTMEVQFNSANNRTPTILYFKQRIQPYSGSSAIPRLGYTYSDTDSVRTYNFWIKKNEGYGAISVNVDASQFYMMGAADTGILTFPNVQSDTEPAGIVYNADSDIVWESLPSKSAVSASAKQVGYDKFGQVVLGNALAPSDLGISATTTSVTVGSTTANIPQATTTTPKMDGTAAVGTETKWAKGDHVHPTDTSRAPASHTHGSITNDGKIGTTANLPVITGTGGAVTTGSFSTTASAVGTSSAAGTANTFSRGDHVHSISLATGDSDGQVKIAGSNVSVAGWANKASQFPLYVTNTGPTRYYTMFARMSDSNSTGNQEGQIILAAASSYGATNQGTWEIIVSNRGSSASTPKATMTVRCLNSPRGGESPTFGYYVDSTNHYIYFGIYSPTYPGISRVTILSNTGVTIQDFGDSTTAPTGWTTVTPTGSSSAVKLDTARELAVSLSNTSTTTKFDGSADVTNIRVTGTLPVANGGTGATTPAGAQYNLIDKATTDLGTMVDGVRLAIMTTAPSATNSVFAGYRTGSSLWNYMKGKMSSDTGVNISGNAATATSAGKLTTGRELAVGLSNTSTTTTFDGSANVTNIKVSGQLPVSNGGTGSNTAAGARTNLSVYSKSEVDSLMSGRIEVVTSLPATGQSGIIYYVGPTGSGSDKYDEYIWTGSAFIKVGEHSLDLSNYVNTVATSGSGSVVTGVSKSGNTVTVTKGNISLDDLSDWATETDVTISNVTYHTMWPVAPTSSNQVYGISINGGRLFRIYNNKGSYSVQAYDKDSDTTYTPQKLGSGYGTCTTAEATAAKVVTLTDYELVKNGIVAVKFSYNLCASATLNINGKGAKPVYVGGAAVTATNCKAVQAGDIGYFIYDGTAYHFLGTDRADKSSITGLSVSGKTVTYTRADGETGSFDTQDTTYSFADSYNASTNKGATVATVTNAINALDVTDISGFGTGKTLATLKEENGKISATFQNISITKSQVSDFGHAHGNIQNGGTLQTNDITIANGDKLVVTDSSDSSKVARASISFDGSTTTQALTKAGTWATFNNYSHPAGSAPSKTGVPTANATPGFGGTFKVNQITTDSTSHVSAVTERTITIPNTTATTSAAGLMSAADKTKLDSKVLTIADAFVRRMGSNIGWLKVAERAYNSVSSTVGGTWSVTTISASKNISCHYTIDLNIRTQTSGTNAAIRNFSSSPLGFSASQNFDNFRVVLNGASGSMTIELWYYAGGANESMMLSEIATGEYPGRNTKFGWTYYDVNESVSASSDAPAGTVVKDIDFIYAQVPIPSPTNNNLVAMDANGIIKDSGKSTADLSVWTRPKQGFSGYKQGLISFSIPTGSAGSNGVKVDLVAYLSEDNSYGFTRYYISAKWLQDGTIASSDVIYERGSNSTSDSTKGKLLWTYDSETKKINIGVVSLAFAPIIRLYVVRCVAIWGSNISWSSIVGEEANYSNSVAAHSNATIPTAGVGVGSTSLPVYVANNGRVTACTDDFVHDGDVTSTYSSTGTAPVNGTAVASALGSYLPLSGGTMTGKITALGSQYTDSYTSGAIDMQNSNIVGLNAIYTKDASENASEGIHFYRDATHTDTLWMAGGHMYFVPNRTLAGSSASTSAADSKKVAILPASITSNQMVVTDGTSGDVKGVDAYTGRGVIAAVGIADGRRNRGNASGDGWGKVASINKSSGISNTNISGVWRIVCNTSSTNSVYTLKINIRGTLDSLPTTQLCKMYGTDDFNSARFGIKLVIRGASAGNVTAEIWACTKTNYTGIVISELASGEMEMGNTRKWTYYTVSGGGEAAPVTDTANEIQVVDPLIDTYSWNHFYNDYKEVTFESSVTVATFLSNAQTANSFANKVFGEGLTDTAQITINAIGRLNISNNTSIQTELEELGGYPMFHVVATRQLGYVEFESRGKKVRYSFTKNGALTNKYYEFVKLNNSVSATPSFYAPTAGGTANYVLIGNGTTSAPTWAEKAPKASTADTAAKIATSAKIGDTNKPVYIAADGTVTAISYTIATSVPSGAVFTDTKVTSSANHYAPETASGSDKTASASGGTAAWSLDVVKGVTINTDGKGHITGLSVTSGKLPSNPNTDTKQRIVASDSKTYLTGVTTAPTSSNQDLTGVANTNVYATAGQLHATTFDVNSKCTLQFNTTTNALDFVFA